MTDNNTDAQINRLRLMTRYPVEYLLAGEYRSVFKGRGMDFDELREYVPGDDVRTIDWNVTARSGSPHVRRYIEERELSLWFVVDMSASCLTGGESRSKRDVINEIVALLALSAARNNDRSGLIIFSDRIEQLLPARKGTRHAMRLLNDLLSFRPQGRGTQLQCALDCVGHLNRRRALVIVISDFLLHCDREQLGAIGFRHDLIAVAVNSLSEIQPPVCGLSAVADAESGEQRLLDFTKNARQQFTEGFAAHRRQIQEEFASVNADFLELTTESDCVEALTLFFRNRLRRMADESGG